MGLLLDREDQVTECHVWHLLGLLLHDDGVTSGHTSLDLHLDSLVFLYNPFAAAVGAFSLHGLSFASALVTLCLHLHFHSESHLNQLHGLPRALASWTSFQLSILGSRPSAL